jgi:cellulose synthase/poly-beta-1,6-N-acetylglucosamine synthase-like glycosyltransferase
MSLPSLRLTASLAALGAATVVLTLIAFSLSLRVSRLEALTQDVIEGLALATASSVPDGGPQQMTLVVVPAYNEAQSVGAVVAGLRALALPVLVVDDGSRDGTAQVARDAGAEVLRLTSNLGVGGALRAGVRFALLNGYSQVVQCDGDGQHPPAQVARLLAESALTDAHLIVGSRFTEVAARRQEGLVRWFALSLLAWLASRSAGCRITDSTSGLRVIRRPLLDQLAEKFPRHYLGDTFEVLISAGRAGFVIAEHPVAMVERQHGTSTASRAAAVGLTLPRLRSRRRLP